LTVKSYRNEINLLWKLRDLSAGMWQLLNICGSGSTLKKEAGNGSELGSI